jgi:hypothetical protein
MWWRPQKLILFTSVLALGTCGPSADVPYVLQSESSRPVQLTDDLYGNTPLDATLLRLDRRALDEAYHAQMLKLFGVWIASGAPNEAVQFRNGLAIARRAYGLAAQSIAKREQELLEQERQHNK